MTPMMLRWETKAFHVSPPQANPVFSSMPVPFSAFVLQSRESRLMLLHPCQLSLRLLLLQSYNSNWMHFFNLSNESHSWHSLSTIQLPLNALLSGWMIKWAELCCRLGHPWIVSLSGQREVTACKSKKHDMPALHDWWKKRTRRIIFDFSVHWNVFLQWCCLCLHRYLWL